VLYLLSDSTGNLARHMVTAFLTQFPKDAFTVRPRTFLESADRIEAVFREITAEPGIVFHAFVAPEAKALVARRGRELGVKSCDLTGKFVEFLAEASGVAPEPSRQRLHDVDHAYHLRIRAIDFTLDHDDGLGLETLGGADIVLAGVSRTSKTPTSIYLAQQGYRVANVSLAERVEPPPQLLAMPKDRVAALVIDPVTLSEIRSRRQTAWKMADTSYNELDAVKQEVAWSRRLFARQGWAVFDVTDQAIEETAARIVERLRPGHRENG
jgi:[pyruvate, water dikinase]-phosphate phosphotransferase / [pyruvate, water dikinase] kinase